ncbi:MAG: hydrogenase maturation nickel metallochaperone HypA [Synechococcales cyanobacterium]
MHEVDMTKALMITLHEWWLTETRPTITEVHLQVGEFTCVEPASLLSAFQAQVKGTFLAHCQLHIDSIPFVAFCPPCGQEYRPQMGEQYACPRCRMPLTEIVSGRELKIAHVITSAENPIYA